MCKYSKASLFIILLFVGILFAYYHHFYFDHHLSLHKTTFKQLPQWEQSDQRQALLAFKNSCAEILKRDPHAAFSALPQGKKNQDWQTICLATRALSNVDQKTAQQFFATWFVPYTVKDNLNPHGLFTGYYLPMLQGSLKRTKKYNVPMYGVPADLVKVDLSLFADSNKVIVGQLKQGVLVPYPDRAAINGGILGKNAPVLAWCDSAVDVFFAQIQGSALVQLPHHRSLLLGYARSNGRVYTPIGKLLIENKAIDRKNISMQTIRQWLLEHPEQVTDLLNQDASYVFFMQRENPLGTEQVPLTVQHSLAVDTHYIPLGAPVWLSTTIPAQRAQQSIPYHQLFIAQDTGGAIKGIIRGDIYWGGGEEAAFLAGHMKQAGRYWVLLPK